MKRIFRMISMLVFAGLLAGCGPQQQTRQTAENDFPLIRDRFLAQDGYSFYGRTKLLTNHETNGNYVNFSGQKQNRDMFMQVKLSNPERNRADTMSLLSKDDKMYAQMDGDQGWRQVGDGEEAIMQEFRNWNPEFSFSQMDQMRTRIVPGPDNNPNDSIKVMRVHLDPIKLKAWLGEQMKKQVNGTNQTARAPKLKVAMKLSDGEWNKMAQGAHIQSDASRRNIDEIIRTMEIDASYTINYDQRSLLPTYTMMSIRSAYNMNGSRIRENSQIETHIQSYGQSYEMPDPTS